MFKTVLLGSVVTIVLAAGFVNAAPTDAPRVEQRMQNQEQRIDQGVASGALTPRETGRLEAQQAKIAQDAERMKADGRLTKAERAKLTREQNRANRAIYRKKHNVRRVPVQ